MLVQLGYRANRISVIPNGVTVHEPTTDRDATRERFGLPRGAVVAMLVANLRPEKEVDVFIRAVQAARKQVSDLIGVIVGDGSERVGWPR